LGPIPNPQSPFETKYLLEYFFKLNIIFNLLL
jgi:hypothetical protein